MNDRAASGKRVCRRACWCRDDQAIDSVAADEAGVDQQFHFNHASELAFVDYGFVEDALALDDLPIAVKLDAKHDALAGGEMAGERFFEGRVQIFELEAGEESETAHVDGKNGDAERSGDTRGGEKRAVATEDQKKLGLLGDLFADEAGGSVVEGSSGFIIVYGANPAGLEPMKQTGNDSGEIRAAWARNDADGLERGRWVHVCCVILLQRIFARVEKILLIAFRAGETAGADGEDGELKVFSGGADFGDRFFVEGGVGDDAAFCDVGAGEFELRFYEDQEIRAGFEECGGRLKDFCRGDEGDVGYG
jgi:hypothetical protein